MKNAKLKKVKTNVPENLGPHRDRAMTKPGQYTQKPVKETVKTKGGEYPVYGKKSAAAKSFRKAFADARKAKKATFKWHGRKYTTKLKGED